MPRYRYSSLSASSNIRLLRLLPNKEESAAVRVELFEYSLQESNKATHPYEALSYVWGNLDSPQPIFIGQEHFDVTQNLHTALLHLRDPFFPRYVWIDAICINQNDKEEKEYQIQSMAKIYGKASQVIVWLGESADDGDKALEAIRAAGKEPGYPLWTMNTQLALAFLLDRPWFQRVWVLQEVAAARRVTILCGTTEIDGLAFCLGLEQYQGDRIRLHHRVRAVTYLIRGAIFRSKLVLDSTERVSLNICSLGELIDMYHSHEATQRHDKIFALLGMSADDISESGLLPDYKVPWNELLQRLVHFLLGQQICVKTWKDRESAEISGKGFVIGLVYRVKSNSNGSQTVHIDFNDLLKPEESVGLPRSSTNKWKLHATASPIQKGDVVCLLQGASKSTIIRRHEDHFTIIMIAASPQKELQIETFPRELSLVWNWADFPENSQRGSRDKLATQRNLWNDALILRDMGGYERARKAMWKAIRTYEWSPGVGNQFQITEAVVVEIVGRFGPDVMNELLNRWDHRIRITEAVLLVTARNEQCGDEIMQLLLDRRGDDGQITEAVLLATARNEQRGDEIMQLLLDRRGDENQITESVLIEAARRRSEGVMGLLLELIGDENQITELVLIAAAGNLGSGHGILKLLLDRRGVEAMITEDVLIEAAAKGGIETMELLLERRRDKFLITERLLVTAAKNIWTGQEVMDVLRSRGGEIQITEAVREAMAESEEYQNRTAYY